MAEGPERAAGARGLAEGCSRGLECRHTGVGPGPAWRGERTGGERGGSRRSSSPSARAVCYLLHRAWVAEHLRGVYSAGVAGPPERLGGYLDGVRLPKLAPELVQELESEIDVEELFRPSADPKLRVGMDFLQSFIKLILPH
ncbi:hypothetical protein NDU88_003651 [Pleurodeles waltl]|uniref:Uncharacterized protein n=1 Tax=Pleurodeles waltl TaxID=8319 RepID=A0AAV7QFH8_PLEWA|nr:hypothetical protein NDU88_003651 [Pleurodeles waltl]